jgi:hypothetical protein
MMENIKPRVITGCCEGSKKFKAPCLAFLERNRYNVKRSSLTPKWCVKGIQTLKELYPDTKSDEMFEVFVEINFCPFCGKKTPEIELNTKIKKVFDTDSGDYCDTCKERSMCCKCKPAEFRWKVKEEKTKKDLLEEKYKEFYESIIDSQKNGQLTPEAVQLMQKLIKKILEEFKFPIKNKCAEEDLISFALNNCAKYFDKFKDTGDAKKCYMYFRMVSKHGMFSS